MCIRDSIGEDSRNLNTASVTDISGLRTNGISNAIDAYLNEGGSTTSTKGNALSKDIYHRARAYLNNTDRFDTYTDNGSNLNTRLNGYLSDDFGYMKNGDLHQRINSYIAGEDSALINNVLPQRIKRLQGNGAKSNGGLNLSQRLNNYISDSDFYPSVENQNGNLQQRLNNYLSGSPVENSRLTNSDISGKINSTVGLDSIDNYNNYLYNSINNNLVTANNICLLYTSILR